MYLLYWLIALIQDVFSSLFLTVVIILALLILRYLVKKQNKFTRVAEKLSIQYYYFIFLFVQLFIIVSIFSNTVVFLNRLIQNIKSIAVLIASNLLKVSNYFFFYMLFQRLSVSTVIFLQLNCILTQLIINLYNNTTKQK